MNAESEERPFTGVEWAEQYLPAPIPAAEHHAPPVDLVKAQKLEADLIVIVGLVGSLILAAVASVILAVTGVN